MYICIHACIALYCVLYGIVCMYTCMNCIALYPMHVCKAMYGYYGRAMSDYVVMNNNRQSAEFKHVSEENLYDARKRC